MGADLSALKGKIMSIEQRIADLKQELNSQGSWEERYRYLIKLGKEIASLADQDKVEKFRIKGCQSQVWLVPNLQEGTLLLKADSDSSLVKGIVALLLAVYSDCVPEEVLNTPMDFLNELELKAHLSPSRSNGLVHMLKQIQLYAHACQALIAKGVKNADF